MKHAETCCICGRKPLYYEPAYDEETYELVEHRTAVIVELPVVRVVESCRGAKTPPPPWEPVQEWVHLDCLRAVKIKKERKLQMAP